MKLQVGLLIINCSIIVDGNGEMRNIYIMNGDERGLEISASSTTKRCIQLLSLCT